MTTRYDIPVNYPNNFTQHTSKTERKVSNERLNHWAHEVIEHYAEYQWGGDKIIRAGDSIVIGTRGPDNQIDIFVARDYAHTTVRRDEVDEWRVEVEENG